MRLLMVTPRYFPYMGGIETHVHEVGRRLARHGVEVTLLTTVAHPHITAMAEEEREGMHIIRIPAWPRQRDYYIAPAIHSIITQRDWDLVHCQGCHTFVPPLAMLAAREAHIPYMLTFHTGGHSSSWRNKIRTMQWQLLRPLLKNASKLIGVSHFEADYFRHLLSIPEQQVTVIPNGIELPDDIAASKNAHAASSLIISIGRLEKYKGHQHLIAALPHIREQCPDARLLILGAGPYESMLHALAQQLNMTDYVEIRAIPAQERHLMMEQLSQAALVTLFSEYEAHPIGVIEALALGRPVLVADTSGLHELAEQGLVRAIALNSTPTEIARAALQQMETPLTLPEHFTLPTWDDCASQLATVYHEVAERRPSCVL